MENENMSTLNHRSLGAVQSAGVGVEMTFTDRLSDRLGVLGNILGEAHQELDILGNRQFGPQPPTLVKGSQAGSGQVPQMGRAESVMEALEAAITVARDVADRSRTLNQRI